MKKDQTAFNLLQKAVLKMKHAMTKFWSPEEKIRPMEVLSSLEQPLCVVPACCLQRGRAMTGCLDSWSQSQPGK